MKIPFPKYDEALVLEIERYLQQRSKTELSAPVECDPYSEMAGLSVTYALGRSGVYMRPMFQVFNDVPSGERWPRWTGTAGVPCACGDFSRSWNCSEHGEVPWDWEKRRFAMPGTSTRPGEEIPLAPMLGPSGALPATGGVVRPVPGCPCPLCNTQAPVALARRLLGLDADDPRRTLTDAPTFSITVEGVFDEGSFSYETERDDPS